MIRMFNLIPRFGVASETHDRLLDAVLSDWMTPTAEADTCEWLPPSDMAETDTHYHVSMELPGIDIQKLDISFSEEMLKVKGEKTKGISLGEACRCTERYIGPFERSFRIPGRVDADNIEAKYRDGILMVSLAKSDKNRVKKIEIH